MMLFYSHATPPGRAGRVISGERYCTPEPEPDRALGPTTDLKVGAGTTFGIAYDVTPST
jgi:hypothetical protein